MGKSVYCTRETVGSTAGDVCDAVTSDGEAFEPITNISYISLLCVYTTLYYYYYYECIFGSIFIIIKQAKCDLLNTYVWNDIVCETDCEIFWCLVYVNEESIQNVYNSEQLPSEFEFYRLRGIRVVSYRSWAVIGQSKIVPEQYFFVVVSFESNAVLAHDITSHWIQASENRIEWIRLHWPRYAFVPHFSS